MISLSVSDDAVELSVSAVNSVEVVVSVSSITVSVPDEADTEVSLAMAGKEIVVKSKEPLNKAAVMRNNQLLCFIFVTPFFKYY